MKPVQLADLEAAMRVLLVTPRPMRRDTVATMLQRADSAERYRQITGRPHPVDGAGTLMSVACRYQMADRPAIYDANVLDAFTHVISGLQKYDKKQAITN